MFWLNLSILVVTTGQWWVYQETMSAAALTPVADDEPTDYGFGSADNDRLVLRYFQHELNNIMTTSSIGLPAVRHTLGVVPKATTSRSRLSAGFFKHHRPNAIDKKLATRRRVTLRPKDVTVGSDNTKNVTNDGDVDGGGVKTTKSTAVATRILFSTENECVSTNPGRACVCYMTDFLDLICQRLNEAVAAGDGDGDGDNDETAALRCRSFKPVPVAFIIYPATTAGDNEAITATTDAAVVSVHDSADVIVERNGGKNGSRGYGRGRGGVGDEKAVAASPVRKDIDFDTIVNYRLEKSSDDHYAVQYDLVGSDAKVQCLINGNGTRMNAFKWDFKKGNHKTNSTVTGTDTSILLILGLEPRDSKNYTCKPSTDVIGDSRNGTSYKHYVIAVKKAIYEINGVAVYKTLGGGGCTHEMTVSVQKQLPSSMRNELCPEGSSQYACNVVVEKPKCTEDKRTMEIKYLVTLNDKANYLARIRTSKKGRIALCYQKVLAKISKVLASNLNKTLTVQIMSKLSLIDTYFEPDYSRMNITNFVSCAPGFGIREVFCAACPPHHYSPDKSIECLKCIKGFHQPVAGSEKCVKCRNIFSDGCYMKEVSPKVYWFVGFSIVFICSVIVFSCACCCREENEESIKIIPRKISRKFKKTKKHSIPSPTQTEETSGKSSVLNQSYGKFKNQISKFKKKSKSKLDLKMPFNNVHEKYGKRIQDDHITKESNN